MLSDQTDYWGIKAFAALLAYRINKRLHFEQWSASGSHDKDLPIPDGQKEEDFARMFGVEPQHLKSLDIITAVYSWVDKNKAIKIAKLSSLKPKRNNRKSVYDQREEMKAQISELAAAVKAQHSSMNKTHQAVKELAAKEYRKYNLNLTIEQASTILGKNKKDILLLVEDGFLSPIDSSGGSRFMLFSVIDAIRAKQIKELTVRDIPKDWRK